MPGQDKRTRLTEAAAEVVYRQGFRATTLAHIAEAADVPLGNVYYYFKTKDALGRALVDTRRRQYERMLERWDELDDPHDRLEAFIGMTTENRVDLVQYGCPIGSLCTELQKSGGKLAESARELFELLLHWLRAQFVGMGCSKFEASEHAVHLLSGLQGATLLSHALGSTDPVLNEGRRLLAWLKEIRQERSRPPSRRSTS